MIEGSLELPAIRLGAPWPTWLWMNPKNTDVDEWKEHWKEFALPSLLQGSEKGEYGDFEEAER